MDNFSNKKNAWVWLWLSAFVFFIDQVSKHIVVTTLHYAQPYAVFPFFNLSLQYNAGTAFGALHTASGWQIFLLSGIAIIVSLVLILWLRKVPRNDWMMALGLSLILGGALGNLVDRIRFRYVIDFFDFHIGAWHFATFNIADAAITIGAVFLIIRLLFVRNR